MYDTCTMCVPECWSRALSEFENNVKKPEFLNTIYVGVSVTVSYPSLKNP